MSLDEPPERERLPTTVLALGWVSFCTDLSSEMIVPLLPAFLAGLGTGPAFLGLVEGTASAVVAFLKGWAGRRSDRGRRKPWVLGGYAISSATRPLLALAGSPLAVLGLRVGDRVGKGLRSAPRDALLAAVVDVESRGRAFGLQRAMDHAGALLGSLSAAALLALGMGPRPVFALAAVPAAAAVAVLWRTVHEPPGPPRGTAAPPAGRLEVRRFRAFLAVVALTSLGGAIDLQLLLRAQELGVQPALAPLLWALLHVIRSGLAAPLGSRSDRLGRRAVIASGIATQVVVLAMFALATAAWQVWMLFGMHGLHAAFTEGAERGLVADMTGGRQGGRAFGVYYTVAGLAVLPLTWGFGLTWERVGAPVAFAAAAGLSLLALAVLLVALPEPSRR